MLVIIFKKCTVKFISKVHAAATREYGVSPQQSKKVHTEITVLNESVGVYRWGI